MAGKPISEIVDFGDSGVFEDVTNYPCILIIGVASAAPTFTYRACHSKPEYELYRIEVEMVAEGQYTASGKSKTDAAREIADRLEGKAVPPVVGDNHSGELSVRYLTTSTRVRMSFTVSAIVASVVHGVTGKLDFQMTVMS